MLLSFKKYVKKNSKTPSKSAKKQNKTKQNKTKQKRILDKHAENDKAILLSFFIYVLLKPDVF